MGCKIIATILILLAIQHASAYVTSPGALPLQRQKQWLEQMTVDICKVKLGELSRHQLAEVPDLMYGWSHLEFSSKECALAVESLAKRVIDERRAGNPEADLTVADYNCMLEGWARSGLGEAAAERCEQILENMQGQGPKPNLSSFKAVLMAWRQAGTASYIPNRAQRILEWMVRLYTEGTNQMAFPDADCFDIVLQIWSRSGRREAPKQAEKLLFAMERLYESTGNTKVKPRTLSFNAVLAAWTKSNDPKAPDRATDILYFMEVLSSKGDKSVAPDSASYNTVMTAMAKSKDRLAVARKASLLLRHVEDSYRHRTGHPQLVPCTILFNTAMGIWAKSNESGAYRNARSILDRQRNLYLDGCEKCKPDVYGYTSVIASCASECGDSEEKAKALNVAISTFRELQKSGDDQPNHVTFGTMLKAIGRLHPGASPTKRRWIRQLFEECCEAGCVGDMVVSKLREVSTPDLYKELMQGYNKKTLPVEWTRNVHEMSEYRKKRSTNSQRKRAEV